MSFSSLTNTGRTAVTKVLYDNFDFYLGFGEIPVDYIDPWAVDADVPSYVAKYVPAETIIRQTGTNIDYPVNKDIRAVIQITSAPVSATGVLNGYINIVANPGIAGNIQVVITPGGVAGNETISFNNGVLTVIIQNNVTTRQQLATVLSTSTYIQSATVITGPNTTISIGVGPDNVYLVDGKDQVIYIENTDFTIGYLNNTSNLLLGSINWIGSKPNDGQPYIMTYWYKSLLSVQTDLIQAFGFKKAVSKNYCVQDPNGSIVANGVKWSISNVPTQHLALLFLLGNGDIPDGKVVRQFGLYSNIVLKTGVDPNNYFTIDQIEQNGDLIIIDNISPFRHEVISSEQISIVVSL